MTSTSIVNFFYVIRVSHYEPSRFVLDDYETLENILIASKYHGMPITLALKHDVLLDKSYVELIEKYISKDDELACWFEVTGDLCERAGVNFVNPDSKMPDQVDRAYLLGYSIHDRYRLIDAYMADFYALYSYYPKTMASWVLDEMSVKYARDKYGLKAIGLCRDQVATDGFTLWGGYINGIYFPSSNNLIQPTNNINNQLDLASFRLLSPDPIYSYEQNTRDNLFGVYTLEPASITGREPHVSWYFEEVLNKDQVGIQYAQLGQENNFLWPNMKKGLLEQMSLVSKKREKGELIVQTMKDTATGFLSQFSKTPVTITHIKNDWNDDTKLEAFWFVSSAYRLSFLYENSSLIIRDLHVYLDNFKSRYFYEKQEDRHSILDAFPVISAQLFDQRVHRPQIKFLNADGSESLAKYQILEMSEQKLHLSLASQHAFEIVLTKNKMILKGPIILAFENLTNIKDYADDYIAFHYRGYVYRLLIKNAQLDKSKDRLFIRIQDQAELIFQTDSNYEDYKSVSFTNTSYTKPSDEIKAKFNKLIKEDSYDISSHDLERRVKEVRIDSPTSFDSRPIFSQDINQLTERASWGTDDFLDGSWFASKEDIIINMNFEKEIFVNEIKFALLYNQRQGIILPKSILLEALIDDKWQIIDDNLLDDKAEKREIVRKEYLIDVEQKVKSLRLTLKNHNIMPDWAVYRGSKDVFILINQLLILS